MSKTDALVQLEKFFYQGLVSVLASENFLSKSSLSTLVAPRSAVVNIVVSTELFTIKIMAVDSF
jgi:hypothetical protein